MSANETNTYSPTVVFSVLLSLLLVLLAVKPTRGLERVLSGGLYLVLGVVGIILLFMWFGTDHKATKVNYNVLWANPLFLLRPFVSSTSRLGKGLDWVFLLIAVVLILTWRVFPQDFNIACLPFVVFVGVRSLVNLMCGQEKTT